MNTGSKDIDTLNVNFRGIEIKAVLVYKNRKNISIKIDPFGKIIVMSPPKISKKIIKDIIIEKGDWIHVSYTHIRAHETRGKLV
ncbi:hypothetical protein SIK49_17985 [Clostridioides difficile]|uniref:hypothetical protein n=1 Tax=Clostridioides difficile TaxID=1496 RepID=UPI0029C3E8A5|nr:hypothetical protein [Clostridioides difficile]MDX5701736.1 hypothetical protein [Clostridioides difficile]